MNCIYCESFNCKWNDNETEKCKRTDLSIGLGGVCEQYEMSERKKADYEILDGSNQR